MYQFAGQNLPDNLSSVVLSNSTIQKGLGNSLVLLLSAYIPATHNKHAWETGKPKNVEISANLGMRKLALKSICATFSMVTPPPFSFDLKFYLINFEYDELLYRFTHNRDCDFKHTSKVRGLFGGGRVVENG